MNVAAAAAQFEWPTNGSANRVSIYWLRSTDIEKIPPLQALFRGWFSKANSNTLDFEILSPLTAHFFSIPSIPMMNFENLAYYEAPKASIFSINWVRIAIFEKFKKIQWESSKYMTSRFDYPLPAAILPRRLFPIWAGNAKQLTPEKSNCCFYDFY